MTKPARKRWTLVAAIIGLNITILDETVVFLALPAINRDLHVSLNGQEWIVNAYLLSLSALLLIGGSLADFLAAVAYSLLDSVASALPPWPAAWPPQKAS